MREPKETCSSCGGPPVPYRFDGKNYPARLVSGRCEPCWQKAMLGELGQAILSRMDTPQSAYRPRRRRWLPIRHRR